MTDKKKLPAEMYVAANTLRRATSAVAFLVPQLDDTPAAFERLHSWCDALFLRWTVHGPDSTFHFHILYSPSPEEGGFRTLRANPGDYIVSEAGMISAWSPDKFYAHFDTFVVVDDLYPQFVDPPEPHVEPTD